MDIYCVTWYLLVWTNMFVLIYGINKIGEDCDGPVCLHLYDADRVTWQESYDRCRSEGLELVWIENGQIQTAVERILTKLPEDGPQAVWTAGRGSDDDTWTNMNGSRFSHTVMSVGDSDAHCVYANISRDSITYHDSFCDEKGSKSMVICQYDKPDTGNCPDGWNVDKCYQRGPSNTVDWFGAQIYCSETYSGGDVAYSIPPELYGNIVNLTRGGADHVQLWLGVRRRIWYWRTGPDTGDRQPMDYFNWDGVKGRYSTDSKCVYVYHRAGDRWKVAECEHTFRYVICMGDKPTTSTTPATSSLTTITTTITTSATTSISPVRPSQDRDMTSVGSAGDGEGSQQTMSGSIIGLIVMGVVIVILVGVITAGVVWWRKKSTVSQWNMRNTQQETNDVGPSYDMNGDAVTDSQL